MESIKKYITKIYNKFSGLNKRKKTYLIVIILIILIMMWAFISAGIITANFNRAQVKNASNEQKVDAIGVIITETKNGQKYFEIYGETGHYSNDHSVATLNNVIGNFYKNNEVSMSFQSSKGTYDEKTGIITLFDNTYIVLKEGISLKTDKLTWSGSDKETIAEGHVIIEKDKEMVSKADICVIGAGYDKFRIIGNTSTKVYKSK